MIDHAARADLDALRAEMSRLETGGKSHRPPRSSPDPTPSGDDRTRGDRARGDAARGDRARGDAARDPEAVARAIVLRQLTNAPKTRAQLESALASRHCDPQVARRVLDRLTEVGLIDDAAYAETFVRSKQNARGLARRALAHELRGKGVDEVTAQEVLDRIPAGAEEERARELVRSRLARMHGLERQVTVRRLAGMLARKGYPADVASRVIFEEVDNSAQHRRD